MWIVANELKGVLRFPGLGVDIPPGGEFDLDGLGRERAESSAQLRIALESGYLRTVRKTVMMDEAELSKLIEERIQSIKTNLAAEIEALYREKTPAQG